MNNGEYNRTPTLYDQLTNFQLFVIKTIVVITQKKKKKSNAKILSAPRNNFSPCLFYMVEQLVLRHTKLSEHHKSFTCAA